MSHRFVRSALLVALLAIVMLLVPLAAQASRKCPVKPADTVLKNGYIYTVNYWQPTAQAVAVRGGKIMYVGCNQVAMWTVGPNTKVVDLHGKMMMPGLEDGHTHLQGYVACNMGYEGGTIDYILGKIKTALERPDQAGMLQSNYVLNCSYFSGASILPAGTELTNRDLDRLSLPVSSGDPMATGTTRPIVVTDLDGHKKWVNSQAMLNAGITSATQTPPGSTIGHYPDGQPNGFFADFSATWGLAVPTSDKYLGFLTSIQFYNQTGTTSIEKASGSLTDLPVWQQMADNGDLTMRVRLRGDALVLGGFDSHVAPPHDNDAGAYALARTQNDDGAGESRPRRRDTGQVRRPGQAAGHPGLT